MYVRIWKVYVEIMSLDIFGMQIYEWNVIISTKLMLVYRYLNVYFLLISVVVFFPLYQCLYFIQFIEILRFNLNE